MAGQYAGEATIQKCQHGVYDPNGDQASCSVCHPVTFSTREYSFRRSAIGMLAVSNGDLQKEPLALRCLSCRSTFLINTNGVNGRPVCPACSEEIDLSNSAAKEVECPSCTRAVGLKRLSKSQDKGCPYCHELLDVTKLLSEARLHNKFDARFDGGIVGADGDLIDEDSDETEDDTEMSHISEEENS